MYTISCEAHFDAAHFLEGHGGKCSNLHGHRWKIRAYFAAEELIPDGESRGMVADFGTVKPRLEETAELFDHKLIAEKDSLGPDVLAALKSEKFEVVEVPFRPTAENFAKYIFDCLKEYGLGPKAVRVYESEDAYAEYCQ